MSKPKTERKFQRGDRVRYMGEGSGWGGLVGEIDQATSPTRFRVYLDAQKGSCAYGITAHQDDLEALAEG